MGLRAVKANILKSRTNLGKQISCPDRRACVCQKKLTVSIIPLPFHTAIGVKGLLQM